MDFKKLLALAAKNQVKKEHQWQQEESQRQQQEEENRKKQQVEPQITARALKNHRIKSQSPVVVKKTEAAIPKKVAASKTESQTIKSSKVLPSDIRSTRDQKHTGDKQNKSALVAGGKINSKTSKNDSIASNRNRPIVAEKKVAKNVVGKTAEIKHKKSSSHQIANKGDLPNRKTTKEQSSSKLPKLDSYQSLLQYAKEQQANTEKSVENSIKNSNIYPDKAKPLPDGRQGSSLQYTANDNPEHRNVKRLKRTGDIAVKPTDHSTVRGQPRNTMRTAKSSERHEIKREALPQKYHDEREKARNHLNNNREKVNVSDQKVVKPRPSSTIVPNRNITRVPRTESKSQHMPRKRRYYEENDLDDFIDDSEDVEAPENNISALISQITGYNPNSEKYLMREKTIRIAESNYAQIQREEIRSSKIGRMEDRIEERKLRNEALLAKVKMQQKMNARRR